MRIIPLQTINHRNDALVIVLGPENIERMKQADAAQFKMSELGGLLLQPRVMIAYEETFERVDEFAKANDINGLLEYLSRGFQFRPELGDHDRGPESIRKQKEN